jgi:hypothetical protein
MNAARKIGSIGTLILSLLLVAAPSGAQKSLSDGVDDLAAKLAKSYGDGKHGKVAIVPLRELGGSENLLGTYIAETLTNSFFDVGYRDIVERQMLDQALQELKLSLTGMIDADSAKKIGKFLHADLVVGGTMTDFAGEVSVNCRMFAVETGQVVAVATTKIVKDDSVKSMLTTSVAVAPNRVPTNSDSERRREASPSNHSLASQLTIAASTKAGQRYPLRVRLAELSTTAIGTKAKLSLTNMSSGALYYKIYYYHELGGGIAAQDRFSLVGSDGASQEWHGVDGVQEASPQSYFKNACLLLPPSVEVSITFDYEKQSPPGQFVVVHTPVRLSQWAPCPGTEIELPEFTLTGALER